MEAPGQWAVGFTLAFCRGLIQTGNSRYPNGNIKVKADLQGKKGGESLGTPTYNTP